MSITTIKGVTLNTQNEILWLNSLKALNDCHTRMCIHIAWLTHTQIPEMTTCTDYLQQFKTHQILFDA